MGLLTIEDVTHWSIPVNNLDESEQFYGDLLGLEPLGRLGTSRLSCFKVTEHRMPLCERIRPADSSTHPDGPAHHDFTVSPQTLEQACKLLHERQVPVDELVYRVRGGFLRASSSISSIPAGTGWDCATPPGGRACLSLLTTRSFGRKPAKPGFLGPLELGVASAVKKLPNKHRLRRPEVTGIWA